MLFVARCCFASIYENTMKVVQTRLRQIRLHGPKQQICVVIFSCTTVLHRVRKTPSRMRDLECTMRRWQSIDDTLDEC